MLMRGGRVPPASDVFRNVRKLVKSRRPCCKRNGQSVFRELILVIVVGQTVKTNPPNGKRLLTFPSSSLKVIVL